MSLMAVPTPISGLPSATPESGDLAVIVHDDVTSKTTLGDILALVDTTISDSTPTTLTGLLTGDGSTVSVLAFPGGTTQYLRADGTWASIASGGTWGSITGTLSAQTDLQSALNAKQPLDSDLTSWASITRASGYDTFAATPSSANLAALLTDETGSGAAVFGTGPTIAAPNLTGSTTAGPIKITASASGYVPALWVSDNNSTLGGAMYFEWRGASANNKVKLFAIDTYGLSFYRMADGGGSFVDSAPDLTISNNGRVGVRKASPTGTFHVGGTSAGVPAAIFQAAVSGYFANLVECQTLAGTVGVSVAADALTLTAHLKPTVYTVATLPSASANAGSTVQVTDSNVAASGNYGATVAGGGANRVKVFSNGTNWVIA